MKVFQILILSMPLVIIHGFSFSADKKAIKIVDQMERSLRYELLEAWYPASLDTLYGGFLSDFTYDWKPSGMQNKMLVAQARHLWTASEAAIFYNDDMYRQIARHAFLFLRDRMMDKKYGGFYMLLNREGQLAGGSFEDSKITYGNAFALYALAAYYGMSADTSALRLACETFIWLDKYAYDPDFGGYYSILRRDGSRIDPGDSNAGKVNWVRTDWKDQNTSIHLLEAFTELYKVWPDSLLRERLMQMLELVRDTVINNRGSLTLYLKEDWTPVSFRDSSEAIRKSNYYFDHISFGHDVETAYLLSEASQVLGIENDTVTAKIARRMVDHALNNGWDNERGGFYDAGYCFSNTDPVIIINDAKVWWTQAEGLNALLLMSGLYPGESKYYSAFVKQWEYIDKYLIDHKHGGWYEEGLDKSPDKLKAHKGSDWMINYHNTRALMNCIQMLKK
jgi:mannobiose 2-epimerase